MVQGEEELIPERSSLSLRHFPTVTNTDGVLREGGGDQPLVLRLHREELHPPFLAGIHPAAFAFPHYLFLLWSGVFQHHGFVAQRARCISSSEIPNAVLQEHLSARLSLRSALRLEMNKDPESSLLMLP